MGNMMKAYVIHSNGQIEALDLADGATEALHVAVSEDIDEIPFTADARFLVDPWAKFKALNPNTVANEIYRALGPDLVEGDRMAGAVAIVGISDTGSWTDVPSWVEMVLAVPDPSLE